MRQPFFASTMLVATGFVIAALALAPAVAQTLNQPPAPAPVKPGPYQIVTIKPPEAVSDPSFEAFRKQLAGIAQKKDRAALTQLVAASFFWIPEDSDVADKTKPAIDNLAKAIGLDGKDALGWEVLTEYAGETTGKADAQRPGVICAPGEPAFDDKAADELANATQTDSSDWVYPVHDGVEVRSGPQPDAAVVDKLGLHLVRALEDESPANAVMATALKVMTPSGKIGYVPVEAMRAVIGPQMCYLKDASGWKIAGFFGGDPGAAH